MITQPEICIYHAPDGAAGGCQDGFAAAWAVRQRWPDTLFWGANYGDDPPGFIAGKRVLVVDFSYPEEVLRAMAEVTTTLTVLDHHKSAQEHLTRLGTNIAATEDAPAQPSVLTAVFDLERSGAGITWDEVWGRGRYPTIVEVCQDRDLWRFALPYTRPLTALLASYPYDFAVWDRLAKEMEDPHRRAGMIREGEAIERARDKDIRALVNPTMVQRMVIGDYDVPVANVPHFWASEAANLLADGEPFAATYFDDANGRRCFSLRVRSGDVDVSEIAKEYGGGGHAKAAGFAVLAPTHTAPVEAVKAALQKIALNPPAGPIAVGQEQIATICTAGKPKDWYATTSSGRVIPVTRLLDLDGDETTDPEEAVTVEAGDDERGFFIIPLSAFVQPITTQ